jgi:hypothetical protein
MLGCHDRPTQLARRALSRRPFGAQLPGSRGVSRVRERLSVGVPYDIAAGRRVGSRCARKRGNCRLTVSTRAGPPCVLRPRRVGAEIAGLASVPPVASALAEVAVFKNVRRSILRLMEVSHTRQCATRLPLADYRRLPGRVPTKVPPPDDRELSARRRTGVDATPVCAWSLWATLARCVERPPSRATC